LLERESGTKPKETELKELSNKYLKIGDLLDDPFDFEIDSMYLKTNYNDIKIRRVKKILGSFLLVAKSGKKLKPTYVHAGAYPVLIDQSIYAFRLKQDKIRLDYLFYQLHTDFFKKQIDIIQRGNTIPYLPVKDFLNTVIGLPFGNEHDYYVSQEVYLNEKKQEAFEKLYRQQKKEREEFQEKITSLGKE
jgi:restriction endonuclease S subunit